MTCMNRLIWPVLGPVATKWRKTPGSKLLVTETFPPEVNGVAMTLGRLVRGLRQRGHVVDIIRPQPADYPNGCPLPISDQGGEITRPGFQLPSSH